MKYIVVDKEKLGLTLTSSRTYANFSIPSTITRKTIREDEFRRLVYFDVLYPYKYDKDRAKGKTRRKYILHPPDPFLVATAAIIWEGLIQGLTWYSIKVAVLSGLDFLRTNKLAPQMTSEKRKGKKTTIKSQSRTELGFSWTEFSESGRPLYRFFLGLRREFRKSSKEQREGMRTSRR